MKRIYLKLNFEDREKAKQVGGYWWHPDKKMWSFPESARKQLELLFPDKMREINKKEDNNIDINLDIQFKRKPYQHQIEMIKKCIKNRKFALFCEMGTGKTQAIINTFQYLKEHKLVNKCLIIAPLSVIETWIEEIEINSNYKCIPIIGTKKQREKIIKNLTFDFYLINYEGMLTLKDYNFNQFEMVVLDESSKIKNHQAKRTKIIIDKFRYTPYKYILSGTPITQSPLDIYPQFKFLDEDILGYKSFYSFRNRYAIMGGYGGYEIVGYKNLAELKARIANYSIQLKKEDCVELPEKIYEKRILEMSKELKEQYYQMKEDLYLQINKDEALTASIILTKILRLQQILAGFYLKENNNKLIELKSLVEENLGNGNQIIIWCRFIDSIKLISKTFQNIPHSILYGDVENRQEQINAFQEGKHKIFIGQIATGGLGINLTKGNIVIYYENTFSLQDRIQSEARAHRIGQQKKVTYVDLLYRDSLDIDIYNAIKNKQNVAEYLVKSFKKGDYKID